MRFTLNESERNSIRDLYIKKGVMNEQLDSVISKAKTKLIPNRFVMDNTKMPINKNVRFYDYTKQPTLNNIKIIDGVYHYTSGGDGYMKLEVKDNEKNYNFKMYLTCDVDSGSFYPNFLVKEEDYKKLLGLQDPLSKQIEIHDKTEEMVELNNKDFFNFVHNMMKSKKSKTYCVSSQLDYSATNDQTGSEMS